MTRLIAALFAFIGLDLFLLALFPAVRLLIDPLLVFLVFLTFARRSNRFLWVFGFGLGLLKDLYSGDSFGAWAGTFALTAWIIGATRHWVEWEDPSIIGVWIALLTLLAGIVHGAWLILADPFLHWGNGQLLLLSAAMLVQGVLAFCGFPKFKKLVIGRSPKSWP